MALTGTSRGRSSGGYGKAKAGAGDKKLAAAKTYAIKLRLQRMKREYVAAPIKRVERPYKAERIEKVPFIPKR